MSRHSEDRSCSFEHQGFVWAKFKVGKRNIVYACGHHLYRAVVTRTSLGSEVVVTRIGE